MVLNYILVGCPCCKSSVVCLVFVMFRLPRVILTAWWSSLQPHSHVLSPTALTFHRDWYERTLETRLSFVVVVPPQRLQLVIPIKIAIIEKKQARGGRLAEERDSVSMDTCRNRFRRAFSIKSSIFQTKSSRIKYCFAWTVTLLASSINQAKQKL